MAYYITDVELLFSTQPFLVAGQSAAVDNSCTMITPNRADQVPLETAANAVVTIPAKLAKRNLLIQVTVDGMTQLVPYMPASICCSVSVCVVRSYCCWPCSRGRCLAQFRETQGVVEVTDAQGKRLPRTYVKVYAKIRGQEEAQFHKVRNMLRLYCLAVHKVTCVTCRMATLIFAGALITCRSLLR